MKLSDVDQHIILARLSTMADDLERRDRARRRKEPEPTAWSHVPSGRPRRDENEETPATWLHVWSRPHKSEGFWGKIDGGPHDPADKESIEAAKRRHRMSVFPVVHVYQEHPVGHNPNDPPPEPPQDDRPSVGGSGRYLVDSYSHYRTGRPMITKGAVGMTLAQQI